VQLQKLTPPAINAFYAELLERGRKDGRRGLSAKSVRNIHGILHRALRDAVRWGRLPRNVADLADPPRWERPEMRVWSPGQLRTFLSSVENDRLYAAWRLVASTGLRRGELVGLRWSNVDLERASIAVVQARAVVRYDDVRVSEPKTARGRRAVALDAGTVAALRAHRARQAADRLAIGPGWRESDLVFTQADGSPIHPQRLTAWFEQAARRAGLPPIRLHDVRHSYATLALQAGIHPKVVSERLGHATVAITLDVYSHVTESMQQEAAATVAALLDAPGVADGLHDGHQEAR
jgi:integrase